jgi:hypothetical protein
MEELIDSPNNQPTNHRRRTVVATAPPLPRGHYRCRRPLSDESGSPSVDTLTLSKPNKGAKEATAIESAWKVRLAKDLALAAQHAVMQQEILVISDDSIHTKTVAGMIQLDLLVVYGLCGPHMMLVYRLLSSSSS